jgi:RHS repeat-associated protein
VNGPGVDNKLRQESAATGALYFLQDHLGSTSALTNADGSVVEQKQYEPFVNGGGSSLTRYGFTGRETDDVTGLIYYRARWYDPAQGRFMTEDPIGIAGGLNAYAYVANNPLSFADPSGLSLETFLNGFWSSLVVSAAVSFAIAAVIAASGGTAAAVIGALVTAYGAYQLYEAIKELATADLCPDEFDEKLGELVGGTLGGMLGGGGGAKFGGSYKGGGGHSGPSGPGNPIAPSNLGRYMPYDQAGNPIPLPQQRVNGQDIPLPLPEAGGRPHTSLGTRVGSDGVPYRQSATFTGPSWPKANGHDVPWSRVDWTDHGRYWDHTNPHQHPFRYDRGLGRGGWRSGSQMPFCN